MRYSGLIMNDITAAPGLCVTLFVQGCPHRCKNCHNPETWDFTKGKKFTSKVLDKIIEGLTAHGIQRSFCLMGGEPLCPENLLLSQKVLKEIKEKVPNTPIYVWSGYTYEELSKNSLAMKILSMADYLIDGPYIEELRDITLDMRGSSNQKIIKLT